MAVLQPTADAQAAALAPSTRVFRRVDIYESDGLTRWMKGAPVTGGSVSVDQTRDERRTIDISFDNEDGSLSSDPDGFWYDKIIKPFRGLYYYDSSGEEKVYEAQVGEFMVDSVASPRFPRMISVQGRDYTKKLLLDKFPTATLFAKGEPVEAVVSAIALNGGIDRMVLPSTGEVLPEDLVFERGQARWEAIKKIATSFGYEVFFDASGYMVMSLFKDPSSSPEVFTFATGPGGTLVDFNKVTNDTEIKNHVVVSGENTDQNPIFAEAENNKSTSPTRIAKLGRRTYEYVSALVTTVAQAQDIADKFLKVMALESFEINLESLVLPWLDVGEIIKFTDPSPSPNDPTRFLLSSLTIPMSLGSMSAVGKRITIVG